MRVEVYILPLPALICITILLTNVRFLQKSVISISNVPIAFGKTVKIGVGQFFLILAVLRFLTQCAHVTHQSYKVKQYRDAMTEGHLIVTGDLEDRAKRGMWRAERDFWICFLSLISWIIFLRMTQVLNNLWSKIRV